MPCPQQQIFPYSVRWTQVRAAEGYWRDDRIKSNAATMEEADSSLVPRKFKFTECASSSDIRKMTCPEEGIDNRTKPCATGYLDVCDPATNGTCRCVGLVPMDMQCQVME